MDIALIVTLLLAVSMVAVIAFDAWNYVIPNTLNLAILGIYPFAAYFLGLDWPMALLAGAIVLAIGMGIFSLGLMGGGDIKLLAVLCVWTGWSKATPQFIMLTAIMGGALVVMVVVLRIVMPALLDKVRHGKPLPRLFQAKQPVPYGLAIAGAFLFMLGTEMVPGLAVAN